MLLVPVVPLRPQKISTSDLNVVRELLALGLDYFVPTGASNLLNMILQTSERCLCPTSESRVVQANPEFCRRSVRGSIFLSLFELGDCRDGTFDVGCVHRLVEPVRSLHPILGNLFSL